VSGQIEIKRRAYWDINNNPMELVFSIIRSQIENTNCRVIRCRKIMFDYGLTTVNDAGLDHKVIDLIDSLQKAKVLKLNVYAMVSANPENLDLYLKRDLQNR
jgi:hypothetical protein